MRIDAVGVRDIAPAAAVVGEDLMLPDALGGPAFTQVWLDDRGSNSVGNRHAQPLKSGKHLPQSASRARLAQAGPAAAPRLGGERNSLGLAASTDDETTLARGTTHWKKRRRNENLLMNGTINNVSPTN